ncbi:MAG: transporter substrate-binding domain-containing protein [Oceanospirillaceae bacterium]|nr:transporter substrate-binding domain-containing protein [Oceanospirillaceae bacterium]
MSDNDRKYLAINTKLGKHFIFSIHGISIGDTMFKWKLLALSSFILLAVLSSADERGTLSIAAEHYPPYEMKEPINGLRGFDYEVSVKALSIAGYETEVEFLPWKRVIQYAEKGIVVGILSCAFNKERENYIIFSDPISAAVDGFYVRKKFSGPKPTSLEDVKEERVGSVFGYASTQELESIGFVPMTARNTEMAISLLLKKRFDYLYIGQQSTDFIIKELGVSDLLDFYPIHKIDYHLCFSKRYEGIKPIVKAFNAALLVLRKNGTYRAIHDKYK